MQRTTSSMLGDADQHEIRALFEQVFGAPMSEALWRWKYDEGRGAAAGVRSSDTEAPPGPLIAHYGGTRRTLGLGRELVLGVQMGDVMVRPDARGILSRNGPFAKATRHFIDENVGEPPRFAIGFGFPSQRHARLGELLGLYRALGQVLELDWPATPARGWSNWRWRLEPLVVANDDPRASPQRESRAWAAIDDHWRTMRATLTDWVLPQRDADWCRHRYTAHPHHRYRIDALRCRFTGRSLGVMVIREHGPTPEGGLWEWMDWIGAPRHMPLALATARAHAAQAGVASLRGWFSAPLVDAWLGGRCAPATVVCSWCVTAQRAGAVPANIDTARWWLTSGDTDFR